MVSDWFALTVAANNYTESCLEYFSLPIIKRIYITKIYFFSIDYLSYFILSYKKILPKNLLLTKLFYRDTNPHIYTIYIIYHLRPQDTISMQLSVQLSATTVGGTQSKSSIHQTRHLIGFCKQLLQIVARKVA